MEYGIEYYENLLRIQCETAKLINTIRWEFVKSVEAKTVYDFGCGIGAFRAFRPEAIEVDTYDIMDVIQTGVTREKYDLVTLWDVLEHTDDPKEMLRSLPSSDFIACTVPIRPVGRGYWKHDKPGEHLTEFTRESIKELFSLCGYELTMFGKPECPPREDIHSFLFKRCER